LIRNDLLAGCLVMFIIFVREYSTGLYLLGPGTEVIGSILVCFGVGAQSIWFLRFQSSM
jgi:iron(III) transport system permease protein